MGTNDIKKKLKQLTEDRINLENENEELRDEAQRLRRSISELRVTQMANNRSPNNETSESTADNSSLPN